MVIPRGIRFAVQIDGPSRGYILEGVLSLYVLLLFVFMSVPIFLFTCLYLDFIYVHTYICVYSYRKPFPAYVLLFFFRRKKHFIQRKFSAGIRPTWSKWTGNSEDSKIIGA